MFCDNFHNVSMCQKVYKNMRERYISKNGYFVFSKSFSYRGILAFTTLTLWDYLELGLHIHIVRQNRCLLLGGNFYRITREPTFGLHLRVCTTFLHRPLKNHMQCVVMTQHILVNHLYIYTYNLIIILGIF